MKRKSGHTYSGPNRDKPCKICGNIHINGMLGKRHSEKTRKKLSELRKGKYVGKDNPFYGCHHTKGARNKISIANKGRKMSEEHKRIIIKTHTGKIVSTETRIKISEAKKGKYIGEENPFYGKHHTEEAKRKISEANKYRRHTEESKRKMSKAHKGKKHTEETKRKISESHKGKKNGMYGKPPPKGAGYGRQGRRKDLNNQFFRSTWEANMARVLNLVNIKWEYEPRDKRCYFPKEGKTYMPDFYLPEENLWIEISGRDTSKKRRKLELSKKYYSDRNIVHITWPIWEIHFLPYKNIIQNWET